MRLSIPAVARRRAFIAAIAACATLAVPAPGAMASHSETTFFEAPAQLLSPATRVATMRQLRGLGVTAIRVELHWRDVAPY
jgi:hypothetical protein